jgi:serralysin
MSTIDISSFTLSFTDEFNDVSLQQYGGTWRTSYNDSDTGRLHGDELQIYVDYSYLGLDINPFSIVDGVLSIHAQAASDEVASITGQDYTSGMLSSRGTYSQTYGYFEIKCDAPEVAGTWPAFWLLPVNGTWPPELDVFETLGQDTSTVYTTAHTQQNGMHEMSGISSAIAALSEGMHTYGVLWTAEQLVWYIDGVEVFRTDTPADMHEPMYMVTNLALGGWAGDVGSDFEGADYKVDYIKAYTLESTPYPNIVKSDYSVTLDRVANGLVLTGAANSTGIGNSLDNTLTGNSGNNVLDGGAGADTMAGGLGDDSYTVDNTGDVVTEAANSGTDRISASISLALGANIENLVLTGTANVNGTGNSLANTLTGNAGNNVLDGGTGIDTLAGGLGDDTYIVDNSSDVITEWSSSGTDSVQASVSYVLLTHTENLTLTGTGDINATGNWLNNILTGNAGNNVLDGSSGADTLIGDWWQWQRCFQLRDHL